MADVAKRKSDQPHFYSGFESFIPYFKFFAVKSSLENTGLSTQQEELDQLKNLAEATQGAAADFAQEIDAFNFQYLVSIEVTREANFMGSANAGTVASKSPTGTVSFRWSATKGNFPLLLPYLVPGKTLSKRVVITNGYISMERDKRRILLYKVVKIGDTDVKDIPAGGQKALYGIETTVAVGAPPEPQTKATGNRLGRARNPAEYFGYVSQQGIAFSGIMNMPSITGGVNGIIDASFTMSSIQQLSAFNTTSRAHYSEPKIPGKPAPARPGGTTPAGPGRQLATDTNLQAQLADDKARESDKELQAQLDISRTIDVYVELETRLFVGKDKSKPFIAGYIFNIEGCKEYKVVPPTKNIGRVFDSISTGGLQLNESPNDYLDRVCRLLNVAYITLPTGEGLTKTVFFPNNAKAYFAAIQNPLVGKYIRSFAEPPGTPELYAIVMRYGEAVSSFNWNFTPVQSGSGNASPTVNTVTDDGNWVTLELNEAAIKEYAKAKGLDTTNITTQSEEFGKLLEWAKNNIDDFIAHFTKATGTLNRTPTQIAGAGAGASGVKLTLDLKWGMPGLTPGELIYFDGMNTETMPSFLAGVYIIEKVSDKFDGKDRIFSQTIECIK